MIQLNKPVYHPEAYENVKRVLDSGWTGLGPETAKFEEEFANYIGAKYAIGLSSGTEALRLALEAADPTEGSYAITTPNTFVSTNHVLLQKKLVPLFADIDAGTGSIDVNSVIKLIDKHEDKIKTLMVVHYGGNPADIGHLRKIAEHYKLILIEDCAHACGATFHDEMIGSRGKYNCFSFHAVKNLSMGDGGAITTDSEEVYNKVRQLRWLGIDKGTADRTTGTSYSWDYDCPIVGFKSHMNDITAAIGRGQLLHLDEDNAHRAELVDRYYSNILYMNRIDIVNKKRPDRVSSNHLFVVRFPNHVVKDHVMEVLKTAQIGFGYHYRPNYFYDPYTLCEVESAIGMRMFFDTALTIPLHLGMDAHDVDLVCDIIREAL